MAKKKSASKKKSSATKASKKSAAKAASGSGKPMAAKSGKKTGKETGKKTGRSGGMPAGMSPVTTGSGASPAEIGTDLVRRFNAGQMQEIEDAWWSPKIVSVEGMGVNLQWAGRKAVEGKNAQWMQDHVIHGASAEGPFVGSSGFAVKFRMDVETKSTGQRVVMEEVGVYTVQNGKIVREEFMYGMPPGGG